MRYTKRERLEDLTDLYKVRAARFTFYPDRSDWREKARQFGISEAEFEKWAASKAWFVREKVEA